MEIPRPENQEKYYYVLLRGISDKFKREDIISSYQAIVSIIAFKMVAYREHADGKIHRMGVLKLKDIEDISRIVCRYLEDGENLVQSYLISEGAKSVEEIISRKTNLVLSYDFEIEDETVLQAMREYGDMILDTSEETSCQLHSDEHEKRRVVYKVDSSYTINNIGKNISHITIDNNRQVEVAYEDEMISAEECKEILTHAQLDMNRLDAFYQGLGLSADGLLKEITFSYGELSKIVTNKIRESIQRNEGDKWEDKNDNDKLSDLFDDEEDELDFPEVKFEELLVKKKESLNYFSRHSCSQFIDEKSISCISSLKPQIRSSVASKSFTVGSDESKVEGHKEKKSIQERIELLQYNKNKNDEKVAENQNNDLQTHSFEPRVISVEDRIIELIQIHKDLGVEINHSFFNSVYQKIDPQTEEKELLKASLKILKTKIRKIKRKDRKKKNKNISDPNKIIKSGSSSNFFTKELSEEEDDEMDLEEMEINPRSAYTLVSSIANVESRLIHSCPHEWCAFIETVRKRKYLNLASPQKKTIVNKSQTGSCPFVGKALPNEHDIPWYTYLSTIPTKHHDRSKFKDKRAEPDPNIRHNVSRYYYCILSKQYYTNKPPSLYKSYWYSSPSRCSG